MLLPNGRHMFGRVLGADLQAFTEAPMPGSYLIYVYSQQATSIDVDVTSLTPDRLLLPPVFINRMPWTRGYFETVDQQPLRSTDRLAQYCFWDAARQTFVDERHQTLPRETFPCGDWGLSSYRWLDDQISDALDLPRIHDGVSSR